ADWTREEKGQLSLLCPSVLVCCAWVNGEAEIVNAKAGSSVTLNSGKITKANQTLWTYGAEKPSFLIAKVSSSQGSFWAQPQFKERLNLDRETGDLTISKLSLNDTGVYERQRIGTYISSKQFKLEVYSPLSPPSVNVEKSYSGECQVECSVKNSRNLTLTWFKGNDWLQRMSSSDSAGLSLALNLNQRETHKYFCEARNPLENMTARFHPNEICLKNGEQHLVPQ
uniref:Ig-like domain-containing protein n=1 Tax=Neogobius melanostomus TaxID=47308 RepID=A0A8C6UA99_9GOBI